MNYIAHQASPSNINSRSPPKPMSIESVMPSNHLILCFTKLLKEGYKRFIPPDVEKELIYWMWVKSLGRVYKNSSELKQAAISYEVDEK